MSTYENQIVASGATLSVKAGETADKTTVNKYGKFYVKTSGAATDTIARGYMETNGTATRISGYTGADVRIVENGYGSGIVMSGGQLVVRYNGATASGIWASGAVVFAQNQGMISGATLLGGGKFYVQIGNFAHKAGVSAYDIRINGVSAYVNSGGLISGVDLENKGSMYIYSSAVANEVRVSSGAELRVSGGVVSNVDVWGAMHVTSNGLSGSAGDLRIYTKADARISSGCYGSGIFISGGQLVVRHGGATAVNVSADGGTVFAQNTGVISGAALFGGAKLYFGNNGTVQTETGSGYDIHLGSLAKGYLSSGGLVSRFSMSDEAEMEVHAGAEVSRGHIANVAQLYVSGGAVDITAENVGVLRVSSGGVVSGATIVNAGSMHVYDNGWAANVFIDTDADVRVSSGGYCSGIVMQGGQLVVRYGGATAVDVVASESGTKIYAQADGLVSGARIGSGALLQVISFVGNPEAGAGKADNVTVESGGSVLLSRDAEITFAAVESGAVLSVNYDGSAGNTNAIITDLSAVNAGARLEVSSAVADGTYKISDLGNTALVLNAVNGIYSGAMAAGASFTDVFAGMIYTFNAAGTGFSTEAYGLAAAETAGTLAGSVRINDGDRAAKWTDATRVDSGAITLADDRINGDAWLEIAGANVNTALYGATGSFAGAVNLKLTSGEIQNLAAGAADAAGSVGAVNLTITGGAMKGASYAGGFGHVTGTATTEIAGGTFGKAFYAGALRKSTAAGKTTVGDLSLTVTGGDFSGNLFGASAVKVKNNTAELAHEAGKASVTLAANDHVQDKFCMFGGGYITNGEKTGRTPNSFVAYTVNSTEVTVSGGAWGTANGGRGIFGGVFASCAAGAVTGGVNISITGGSVGNVYGGGWAQQAGTSVVTGGVNITISGGTAANIFGGGSHSTSSAGNTTSVEGGVNITVSGGNITGDIYARGHLSGDDVSGNAAVTFTGNGSYTCGVYGYDYVEAPTLENTNNSRLDFADFTGSLGGAAGKIVGFDNIAFSGATAATWNLTADNVDAELWTFDLAGRSDTLAGNALLNWSDADFTGDTLKLNLLDSQTLDSGWSIAGVGANTEYGTFAVMLNGGGDPVGTASAFDTAIGGDSVYKDWGFKVESGVLKFCRIA